MAKTKQVQLDTWEKVCEHKGISPEVPFDVSMLPKAAQNFLIAAHKLPIIIEAWNDDVNFPDYRQGNSQYKYELWPEIIADDQRPSGFALSYFVFVNWFTFSFVGVRFAFKSRDTAKQVFEIYKPLFEHFFLKIE
jgi:hypothetical protein